MMSWLVRPINLSERLIAPVYFFVKFWLPLLPKYRIVLPSGLWPKLFWVRGARSRRLRALTTPSK